MCYLVVAEAAVAVVAEAAVVVEVVVSMAAAVVAAAVFLTVAVVAGAGVIQQADTVVDIIMDEVKVITMVNTVGAIMAAVVTAMVGVTVEAGVTADTGEHTAGGLGACMAGIALGYGAIVTHGGGMQICMDQPGIIV
jgi:hypothetical protein